MSWAVVLVSDTFTEKDRRQKTKDGKMSSIQLQVTVTLDEDAVATIVGLLRQSMPGTTPVERNGRHGYMPHSTLCSLGRSPPKIRGFCLTAGKQQSC